MWCLQTQKWFCSHFTEMAQKGLQMLPSEQLQGSFCPLLGKLCLMGSGKVPIQGIFWVVRQQTSESPGISVALGAQYCHATIVSLLR